MPGRFLLAEAATRSAATIATGSLDSKWSAQPLKFKEPDFSV